MNRKQILARIEHLGKKFLFLIGICVSLWLVAPLVAQEDGAGPRFLTITAVSADRLPSIELQMRGVDSLGNPLDFNRWRPTVVHGGEAVEMVEVVEQEEGGTFTILLVDTPPGVSDVVPALKEAIELYMARGLMREQVDFVTLYQVGAQGADELLPATPFHNSIRNVLVEPFPEQNGPTALVDSLGGLLEQIDTLVDDPTMSPTIVVFSDGTDVVSTRFGANDLAGLAAVQGVPIHTIVLDNENLGNPESGKNYLAELAVGTGGTHSELTEQGAVSIWERIDRLRQRTLLRYVLASPTGGDAPIVVSFADYPAVQAGTRVGLPPAAPLVQLTVPVGDQQLTLTDPAQGVRLAFPTTVGWLDGETREVTQAQLWLNGVQAADIDPAELARFEANLFLQTGRNQLWVTLADEDAQQGVSPILTLDVIQGEAVVIPATLQPAGQTGLWIFVVGLISVVLLFIALLLWFWRQPELFGQVFGKFLPKGGRARTKQEGSPSQSLYQFDEPAEVGEVTIAAQPVIAGYALDVLESVTRKESPLGVTGVELRLGRSPAASDLTFENDITVSRLHATLVQDGDSYRLFDEGSTSGTTVNQEVVPDYGRLLVDGDEVGLGAVRLNFRVVYDYMR